MSEIKKFLSLSSEDLETAQFLYESQRFRPCISRAYYAMYYVAQALLLSENLDTSTHKGMIKMINRHFAQTGKISANASKLLNDAYELRQLGDYSTKFVSDEVIASEMIVNAKVFITEVEMILGKNSVEE